MKKQVASLIVVIFLVSVLCAAAITVTPQPVAAKTVPATMEVTYSESDNAWWSSCGGVINNAAAFPSTSTTAQPGHPPAFITANAKNNSIWTAVIAEKPRQGGQASGSLAIWFSGWQIGPYTYDQVKDWPVQIDLRYTYSIHSHQDNYFSGLISDQAWTRVGVNAKTSADSSSVPLVDDYVITSKNWVSPRPSDVMLGGVGYYQTVKLGTFSDFSKGTHNEASIVTATLTSDAYKDPTTRWTLLRDPRQYTASGSLKLTGIKITFDPNYTPPPAPV